MVRLVTYVVIGAFALAFFVSGAASKALPDVYEKVAVVSGLDSTFPTVDSLVESFTQVSDVLSR